MIDQTVRQYDKFLRSLIKNPGAHPQDCSLSYPVIDFGSLLAKIVDLPPARILWHAPMPSGWKQFWVTYTVLLQPPLQGMGTFYLRLSSLKYADRHEIAMRIYAGRHTVNQKEWQWGRIEARIGMTDRESFQWVSVDPDRVNTVPLAIIYEGINIDDAELTTEHTAALMVRTALLALYLMEAPGTVIEDCNLPDNHLRKLRGLPELAPMRRVVSIDLDCAITFALAHANDDPAEVYAELSPEVHQLDEDAPMPKISPIIETRLARAVKDYEPGVSLTHFAAQHNIAVPVLRNRLKKLGIYKGREKPTEIDLANLETAIAEFSPGDSINLLAKKYNVKYHPLYIALINRGLYVPSSMSTIMEEANVVDLPTDATASLSPAVKRKILDEIDTHFDIKAGQYAVGQSDQEIARRLGVPWAACAKLREEFCGPIKGDAELEGLRADIEQWKYKIRTELDRTDFDDFLAEMDRRMQETENKIAELTKAHREDVEWRAVIAQEREANKATVISLKLEGDHLGVRISKVERRFN